MSLSCFFGHELRPDSVAFTPVMPPMSTLVITQACVTSAFPTGGPVTLYVQSHKMPTKIAVATLSPDQDVYHCPLQLIFSHQVSFFLEPAAAAPSPAPDAKKGVKATEGAASAASLRPHVHISGYYERDDLDGGDEEDEESSEDDEFERAPQRRGQGKKGGAAAASKKPTKRARN